MTRAKAIKAYFEADGGKKVENREMIDFAKEDRKGWADLGDMCLAALGETLTAN